MLQLKDHIAITKQRMLKLLNMSEEAYVDMQIDTAHDYLVKAVGCDDEMRQILMSKPMFWAWWRNHWAARDRHFLRMYARTNRADLRELYEQQHDIRQLCLRPNRIILEDSYADLMKEIIKTETT